MAEAPAGPGDREGVGPGVVLEVVVTLKVLIPEPLGIGFVPKVAFTPAGSVPGLKLTLPVKPFDGVTVSV